MPAALMVLHQLAVSSLTIIIANAIEKYLGGNPVGLLYTETAMIIGLTNLLLPFMVTGE